jgi:hypothetical protein
MRPRRDRLTAPLAGTSVPIHSRGADRNVADIGDELAVARVPVELARRMMATTNDDIKAVTTNR